MPNADIKKNREPESREGGKFSFRLPGYKWSDA
jgi:hypothetical protein